MTDQGLGLSQNQRQVLKGGQSYVNLTKIKVRYN